ncbi:MAG TPA: hypothetical protein PKE04_05935, partial [Clostridia bacterium]|nr:hypothetical protein [Clostridia bacterium]
KALQKRLMDDDCYLPGRKRPIPLLSQKARLEGDGKQIEALLDGTDRPVGKDAHAWFARKGDTAWLHLESPADIRRIRLVFDSDLNRETLPAMEYKLNRNMFHNRLLAQEPSYPPKTLVKAYRVKGVLEDGTERVLAEVGDNHRRLARHAVSARVKAVGLELLETWGLEEVRVFGFEVE